LNVHSKKETLWGIGLAVLAMACFTALDTTTKWVSLGVPVVMAIAVRYLLQAVIISVASLPVRGKALLKTHHPWLHLLRGLMLLCTSVLAFLSLRHMPVGEFTSIVLLTPLVITLIAAHMLHEPVSWKRKLLVAGGFVGTLVIVRPGGQDFNWGLLFPVGLVLVNAAFQLLTSRMTRTEDPLTIQFYSGWLGAVLPALVLPWFWAEVTSPALWAGLVFMAVMATVGHYLFTLAFKHAPVATLMPYVYGQIAFAVLSGWIFFAHVPDHWSWLGMGLIAVCGAAGVWLTAHESRIVSELPEH
jgi:drug/metabolite transporter (DMT)-like permease